MNAPSTSILSARALTLLLAGASLDLLPPSAAVAATNQLSTYALLSSSKLTDDCQVCDRLPIQAPMQGTFTLRLLEQTPLFARYSIEDISFVASNAGFGRIYTVKGTGTYQQGVDAAVSQDLSLTVEVNDGTTNKWCYFTNGTPAVTQPWPTILASVTQTNGTLFQQFSLDLAAAPLPKLLDFETIPGGTATNGLIISNQFAATAGVNFRPLGGATVALVQTGTAASGYGFCLGAVGAPQDCTTGNHLYADDPLATAIGRYFLSLGGTPNGQGFGLIVDLDSPVAQAGGFILDIDGSEEWTVRTYNDTNGVTQTGEAVFTAGNPGTGDGRSTLWSFNHPAPDIREIQFVYTGSSQNGVGVGFDLFYIGQLPPDVPVLAIDNLHRISLIGRVGRAYQVDYSASLPPIKWVPVTNVVLPISPLSLIDATAGKEPMRFYRAAGSP